MKKLVIIDLEKDIDLIVNNALIFHLSCGKTKFKNSEILKKNFFSDTKFNHFRDEINKLIFKFFKYLKNNNFNKNLLTLEFFNSRNDKNQLYNKLFYLVEIINFAKIKKIRDLEIITDDYYFYDTYKSIKFKNIKIRYFGIKQNKIDFLFYFLKTLIFYLKTSIYVFIIKLFNNKIKKNFKEGCISIYPFFFKNYKNNFFDNKYLNINFQITDETHLNNSLFQNLKSIPSLLKLKNTVFIESNIKFFELTKNFFISLMNYKVIKKTKKYNFDFNGLNVNTQFFHLFTISFLNNNKMNIYSKPLIRIAKKYELKKFHYYLFEYCFGYHINQILKKNIPSIQTIGYQHGIYSERLMWQDFSKKISLQHLYPDKIFCKYKYSLKTYKFNFKRIKIMLPKINKIYRKLTRQKKEKFNVFLGLHDCYNMINGLRNFKQNYKFILNLHPKLKYDNKLKLTKNMKINLFNKNKSFLKILSSTSTIPYQLFSKEKFFIFVPRNIIPLNPKKFDKLFFKIK